MTDYVDFCQLNLLKNSEIHWFQFIMNSSSHHTAMNYGSRSALLFINIMSDGRRCREAGVCSGGVNCDELLPSRDSSSKQ